jgi:hypothetical protein
MLKLYYWDDANSEYIMVSSGTMETPANVTAGSLRGQDSRITEKLYLRNDEDNTQYIDIQVQAINIPSSWKIKLVPQASEPTEEEFLALPNGNIMEHADVVDKSYYPVWMELIVPQGTAPSVFSEIKFKILSTRQVI